MGATWGLPCCDFYRCAWGTTRSSGFICIMVPSRLDCPHLPFAGAHLETEGTSERKCRGQRTAEPGSTLIQVSPLSPERRACRRGHVLSNSEGRWLLNAVSVFRTHDKNVNLE